MADHRIKVLSATPDRCAVPQGPNSWRASVKPYGAISTLVVAGGEGVTTAAKCEKTIAFVRAMARRGVRIASVCSGAYILAEAGLLDGRRATTHWGTHPGFPQRLSASEAGARSYLHPRRPDLDVGGHQCRIDLALAMVAEDFGDEVAQNTARQARALSSARRRPIAILLAAGTKGAKWPVSARYWPGRANISMHR